MVSEKKETHYEILGIGKESTSQEVKTAFLNLSKSHHPDLHPEDIAKHKEYVRIVEAYSILSKPELRRNYDYDITSSSQKSSKVNYSQDFDIETNSPKYKPWRDETIWEMRDKETDQFYQDRSYYGIKGVKRMSNLWIAGGAFCVMLTGALFHYIALRKSAAFTVAQLDKKDVRLGTELQRAKLNASENGNVVQLELLEAKLSQKPE